MAEIGTDIEKAIHLLNAGQLVGIPTETVYGLAGNALREETVARIFAVKNRPSFDPLIVHVPGLERVHRYVTGVPDKAVALTRRFWPGPLTILFPKLPVIPDLVTAGLDTVGIRCPDHPVTRALLHRLDFPLAAPSANPFGYISPTTAQHVDDQLGKKISYILDGGPCTIGIESTIVGFEGDDAVIFRTGAVAREDIEQVIGNVSIRTAATDNPVTPGQLHKHYSPHKKMLLGDIRKLLTTVDVSKAATLSLMSMFPQLDRKRQLILSPTGNLEEAAKNLFSTLRQLDKLDVDFILAEEVPDTGIGRAINDRLRRAAVIE